MRQKRIAFLLSALMATACTQQLTESVEDAQQTGELSVLVSIAEEPSVKAELPADIFVPELEDIKVEIFKNPGSEQVRLFRELYGNIISGTDSKILLNCGNYRLLASYGDSLGVGPDKPYYKGICDFTLEPQESRSVATEVRVSNVRAIVDIHEDVRFDYPESYAVVRSVTKSGKERTATYEMDDDKAKFLPLGDLYLEWYVEMDGTLMYYPAPVLTDVKPGDDIRFVVQTEKLLSGVQFTVTVIQPDRQPVTTVVSDWYTVKEKPTVGTDDFEGDILVVQGDDVSQMNYKMDIVAEARIDECHLLIESDYLQALGVPSDVDLADPALSADIRSALESVGLRWMDNMQGRRLAYVDFTGVAKYLSQVDFDPDNAFRGEFSLSVVDQRHDPEETLHDGVAETGKVTFIQGVPTPSIRINGFDDTISIMEATGTSYDNLHAEVVARGRIGACVIDIDSPYLAAAGLPQSIDLVSADAQVLQKLRDVGISWPENISSLTDAKIDFSGLSEFMDATSKYDSAKGTDFATFNISVSNSVVHHESYRSAQANVGSFRYIVPSSPSNTGNISSVDVWAKRIYNYSTVLADGNPQKWKLQYSSDGTIWNDMSVEYSDMDLRCGELRGLSSSADKGVDYSVRAIYNDNQSIVYPLQGFTTEVAAQVPNAGFEDWQTVTFNYTLQEVKIVLGSFSMTVSKEQSASRSWYLPYLPNETAYWDVNSRLTMPLVTTPREQPYKVFPAVSYSTDAAQGGKSAQMVGTYVSNMATSASSADSESLGGMAGSFVSNVTLETYQCAGEIFIGTANNFGGKASSGCEFHSRPDKLKFKYKYSPCDSEQFQVIVWLQDASGKYIARGQTDAGPASTSWAEYTLPLTYEEQTNTKADKIFISFRSASCADDKIAYDINESIEMAGSNFKGHLGSVLKIDDLQLLYE